MTCSACHALIGDDARFCPMCGAPVSASSAAREARKNVAILFMDLVGSTALTEKLDPEPWRQIIDRYFAAARSAIEAHGGEVEKFIGDAVMAVFGATVSHEDDALRAVRAAMEAIAEVGKLSADLTATHKVTLEVRCGICSGEVIAITERPGDFRVIGDPVNTAARLQTAAEPGEILIDATSASMVRATIGLDPVPPLELKGKAQPVLAWRVTLGEPPGDATGTPPAAPLIGRDDELGKLRSAWRRVTASKELWQVTVLGSPGIGKSRLVRDFVDNLPAGQAIVLTGKCSAYGRGITYKPLADMLRSVDGGWDEHARNIASGGDQARRAADCLSGIVLGDQDTSAERAGVDDISWAVRDLLRRLGKAKPVVMIWDDLHWASSTLLKLIDDVAEWLIDVPVLLICIGRPELAEARPSWAAGRPSAMRIEVGPLSYEQSAELVTEIAMREEVYAHEQDLVCERVARECEGNPLFAELMLDVFADSAPAPRLPPAITALMTARFDQLPDDERRVLEIASAIGRDFSWTALRAVLAADQIGDSQAQEIVARLVERRIISRVSSDNFRFGQALMRDTAYGQAPKSRRESLHLLLAERLAMLGADGSGTDDPMALALHVETASALGRELRPGDTGLPGLAATAAEILIGEGMRALHRQDQPGAAALLERGRGLVPASDEQQIRLMLYISDCWYALSEPDRAFAAVDFAAESAAADRRRALVCTIQRNILELRFGLRSRDEIAETSHLLAAELRWQGRDDRASCRLHQLKAYLHYGLQRHAKAEGEFRLALDDARRLRDSYEEGRLLVAICELSQWSPTSVEAGLRLCAEMAERFETNRVLLIPVLLTKARLAALGGDLNGARAALAAARARSTDMHLDLSDALLLAITALVDSLAGEHRLAEMGYRHTQGMLIEMGRPGDAIAYEAYAAREVFEQGKVREAGAALARLIGGGQKLDLRTQVITEALSSRVAAVTGRAPQVVDLAIGTAKLSEQTDDLCLQGSCYSDLAIVAAQAGQQGLAAEAASTALEKFRARGATRLASRAERLLAAVDDRQPPERSAH